MAIVSITPTTITAYNGSTNYTATTGSTMIVFAVDDMSKAFVHVYQSDTAALSLTVGSPNDHWIARGAGSTANGDGTLTVSVGSSEYHVIGPFESARFRSSNSTAALTITTSSTSGTNATYHMFILP